MSNNSELGSAARVGTAGSEPDGEPTQKSLSSRRFGALRATLSGVATVVFACTAHLHTAPFALVLFVCFLTLCGLSFALFALRTTEASVAALARGWALFQLGMLVLVWAPLNPALLLAILSMGWMLGNVYLDRTLNNIQALAGGNRDRVLMALFAGAGIVASCCVLLFDDHTAAAQLIGISGAYLALTAVFGAIAVATPGMHRDQNSGPAARGRSEQRKEQ